MAPKEQLTSSQNSFFEDSNLTKLLPQPEASQNQIKKKSSFPISIKFYFSITNRFAPLSHAKVLSYEEIQQLSETSQKMQLVSIKGKMSVGFLDPAPIQT